MIDNGPLRPSGATDQQETCSFSVFGIGLYLQLHRLWRSNAGSCGKKRSFDQLPQLLLPGF